MAAYVLPLPVGACNRPSSPSHALPHFQLKRLGRPATRRNHDTTGVHTDTWVHGGGHVDKGTAGSPAVQPNRAAVLISARNVHLTRTNSNPARMNISLNRFPLIALLATSLHLGAPQTSFGQIRDEEEEEPILIEEDDLNELLMWIVDEKYEKVLYKAIRYTEDDEQKKHPMPYLYMSKAYMGIHNSDDPDCASPSKWTS